MSLFNNNQNNDMNDKFKSLKQGLGIISERKNNILSLKQKINHSKDNVIEGFVEGNTNINDCDTGTVDEKIKCYKVKQESKGQLYQDKMESYNDQYKIFLENLNKAQTDVSNCKLSCLDEGKSPDFVIRRADFGDGDSNKIPISKYKTMARKACKIGCHLNLPQIMDCALHEKFGKVDTFPLDLTDIKKGMTCNQIYTKHEFGNNVNQFGTSQSAKAQTDLLAILDASGNNAYDHCCQGKLGEQYKPYKIMHNTKYTACTQFEEPNVDPGGEELSKRNACIHGKGLFNPTINDYDFKDKYTEIVGLNETMMDTSKQILDIVKDLKALGETIVQSKKEESMKFRNDNEKYETILTNIKDNSDPLKVNTMNQFIKDKTLLKKSTDLRLYVWFVLALGFGISALMKIKQL